MSLKRTKDLILALRPVAAWPEMVELVERVQPRGSFGIWEYPLAACEAVGGSPEAATRGSAAILCSLLSIHLVDDMLDEDEGGDYHRLGAGSTANLALAFQAAGHQTLDDAALAPQTRAALQAIFSRMSLATAYGQSLDVRELRDEDEYWRVVGAKTPPLFAAAFSIGALLGGAPPDEAERLGRLGGLLGLCVQVSDDLLDALRTPAAADWNRRPNNLAILYAMTADYPEREVFLDLSARTADPAALAAAQEILVRCGALSYCTFKLLELLGEAREAMERLRLPSPEPVQRLFDIHTEPLHRLFAAAGDPDPAFLSLHHP
jgi:geranylgeranyl pyrophosphate synthase